MYCKMRLGNAKQSFFGVTLQPSSKALFKIPGWGDGVANDSGGKETWAGTTKPVSSSSGRSTPDIGPADQKLLFSANPRCQQLQNKQASGWQANNKSTTNTVNMQAEKAEHLLANFGLITACNEKGANCNRPSNRSNPPPPHQGQSTHLAARSQP